MINITLFNKKQYQVTESEFKTIMEADNLVHIQRLNAGINKSGIADYYIIGEENKVDLLHNRQNSNEGIVHTGEQIIRHFGHIFLKDGDYDDRGNPKTRLDPRYYPEVARDCIPRPDEYFRKYANIENKEDRLNAILGDVGYNAEGKYLEQPKKEGFKQLNEITDDRRKKDE